MSDTTQAGHALCVACGLCCDGTLFSFAPLDPHEDKRAGVAHGIIADLHAAAIPLPCRAHDATCGCRIYADRPGICRSFRCHLLRRVQAGEVDPEQALDAVRLTRRTRDQLLEAMADMACFIGHDTLSERFTLVYGAGLESAPEGFREDHARAYLLNAALGFLIDKHLLGKP